MATRTFAAGLVRFCTLCACGVALAQVVPAAARIQNAQTQPATAAGIEGSSEDDPLQIFRAPLLREGSALVEAVARLQRGPDQNWWRLSVQPQDSGEPAYELAVLPSTRLAEMERILETMPGEVTFQITGRVYVYREGNYLLPSHAAVVSAAAQAPVTARETANEGETTQPMGSAPPVGEQPADATRAPQLPTTARDSAESILSELEQQAGPIARSSAAAGAARAARNGSSAPGGTGAAAPSSAAGAAAPPAAANLQENSAVVNRRGKITRDRSGGWLLVLDADASGLADPPLKLLPCMLLESIEDYARRVGNNSPIVITGQVYLYNGQNYLLPTVYRIPRESSRITP